VTLSNFSRPSRAVVLASLGGQLKSLTLESCKEVDLVTELTQCTQLEELHFVESSTLNTMLASDVKSESFLPSLKKLKY